MVVKTEETEVKILDISISRINKSKSYPWRYTAEIQFEADKDLTMKEKDIIATAIEKVLMSEKA